MEPYIGTIMLFAFPRIPNGWAICNGRFCRSGSTSRSST